MRTIHLNKSFLVGWESLSVVCLVVPDSLFERWKFQRGVWVHLFAVDPCVCVWKPTILASTFSAHVCNWKIRIRYRVSRKVNGGRLCVVLHGDCETQLRVLIWWRSRGLLQFFCIFLQQDFDDWELMSRFLCSLGGACINNVKPEFVAVLCSFGLSDSGVDLKRRCTFRVKNQLRSFLLCIPVV